MIMLMIILIMVMTVLYNDNDTNDDIMNDVMQLYGSSNNER